MCVCNFIESDVSKLNEEQIVDHHVDLITEISQSAREIANLQVKIQFLTDRIEEVELELEARECKANGKMN